MLVEIATTVFHSPLGCLPFRLPPQQLARSTCCFQLPESPLNQLVGSRSGGEKEVKLVGIDTKKRKRRKQECRWTVKECVWSLSALRMEVPRVAFRRGTLALQRKWAVLEARPTYV